MSDLSFEQAPPLSTTFRFFLTAPLFGVAAGVGLAWAGPEALASRWSGATVALLHLLTTGFMLQAMCGALMQFLPVAAGAPIALPRLVAGLAHPLMVAGSLLLASALAGATVLLAPAAAVLGLGVAAFVAAAARALARTPSTDASLRSLRAAVAGLAATAALGIVLALALQGMVALHAPEFPDLVDVHAAWGLAGWATMLLVAVASTVVPMFQMTPRYPAWVTRAFAPLLLAALAAGSGLWAVQGTGSVPALLPIFAIAALGFVFAVVTLALQRRRRRRLVDATVRFFRVAMLSLASAAVLWILRVVVPRYGAAAMPGWAELSSIDVAIGLLVVVGGFGSAICGMLYRIVPFIAWLNLPYRRGDAFVPPNVKQFIPAWSVDLQQRLHLLALLLLMLGTVAAPVLARAAGAALALSFAWLEGNLLAGLRIYRRSRARIDARVAAVSGAAAGRT